jgi:uncharacterized membrane protein required for colicin V production
MNWLDIILAAVFVVLAVAGHERGFAGELFDVLILVAGSAFSFFMLGHLGSFIQRTLNFESTAVYVIIWSLVFAVTGAVLFIVGTRVEEILVVRIKENVFKALGSVFGLFKAFLILFVLLVFLGNSFNEESHITVFKNSLITTKIQNTEPTFEEIIKFLTPAKISEGITKKMKNSVFSKKLETRDL